MRASVQMPPHTAGQRPWRKAPLATGRLLSVDKDTVNHWLPVLGAHCQHVLRYFFVICLCSSVSWMSCGPSLPRRARLTALEQLAAIAGDAWVWIAFSPVHKLVLAWVVGKRTLCAARQLVAQLKAATDGHIPSLPVMPCPTTRKPYWTCMVCGGHPHVRGPAAVFLILAAVRHPTCVMPSW